MATGIKNPLTQETTGMFKDLDKRFQRREKKIASLRLEAERRFAERSGTMAVKLGSKVKDSLTDFEGVAIARTEYLYGCVQVLVESANRNENGSSRQEWIDEQRLATSSEAPVGGPQPTPPSRRHP